MNPFSFDNYKDYLAAYLKHPDTAYGGLTRMAKAAHCQPSYLSQCLSGKPQITPDQAAAIGQFLNLHENEMEYFLTLVEQERSHTETLKKILHKKLQRLKEQNANLAKKLDHQKIDYSRVYPFYYSAWFWSAIHILTSIKKFQTAEAICRKLSLSEDLVLEVLTKLSQEGLVVRTGNRWVKSTGEMHVPKNSPYSLLHLKNWHDYALVKGQEEKEKALNFSAVYSLSSKDVEKIRHRLVELIAEIDEQIAPSPEEDLVNFNIDWVVVGKAVTD